MCVLVNCRNEAGFNPRSHAGSDRQPRPCRRCPSGFNPRSHAGSDIYAGGAISSTRCFNPRSHAGSDSKCTNLALRYMGFNPRSHAGSDLRGEPAGTTPGPFQSTLPRRERRHTPAGRRPQPCFNPRSHAGSDRHPWPSGASSPRFNPRSHAGSDSLLVNALIPHTVSIHAPTQGATNDF